jgi:hypothetical protein
LLPPWIPLQGLSARGRFVERRMRNRMHKFDFDDRPLSRRCTRAADTDSHQGGRGRWWVALGCLPGTARPSCRAKGRVQQLQAPLSCTAMTACFGGNCEDRCVSARGNSHCGILSGIDDKPSNSRVWDDMAESLDVVAAAVASRLGRSEFDFRFTAQSYTVLFCAEGC